MAHTHTTDGGLPLGLRVKIFIPVTTNPSRGFEGRERLTSNPRSFGYLVVRELRNREATFMAKIASHDDPETMDSGG